MIEIKETGGYMRVQMIDKERERERCPENSAVSDQVERGKWVDFIEAQPGLVAVTMGTGLTGSFLTTGPYVFSDHRCT